ncbi:hypothetical protein PVAG01_09961 [Phlyctema vagabunda]|uniref:Uncharacterized protein n=1 Tax=Phlyctema vagabunda TaxID=108571 RepID=A0ABR4P4L3_9HELO
MSEQLKVEQRQRRLVRSHAHAEDVPGTVNLRASDGDDTAYGQALFPIPADDPNDPLLWPNYKKTMILIIVSLYSFLGNSALLGPSVYIGIYAADFKISPTKASGLISYPNLAFGFGTVAPHPRFSLSVDAEPCRLSASRPVILEDW